MTWLSENAVVLTLAISFAATAAAVWSAVISRRQLRFAIESAGPKANIVAFCERSPDNDDFQVVEVRIRNQSGTTLQVMSARMTYPVTEIIRIPPDRNAGEFTRYWTSDPSDGEEEMEWPREFDLEELREEIHAGETWLGRFLVEWPAPDWPRQRARIEMTLRVYDHAGTMFPYAAMIISRL